MLMALSLQGRMEKLPFERGILESIPRLSQAYGPTAWLQRLSFAVLSSSGGRGAALSLAGAAETR